MLAKKFLRRIKNNWAAKIQQFLLKRFLLQHTSKSVVFVDIDNTIANTWPLFQQHQCINQQLVREVAAFSGMKHFLLQEYFSKDISVIYISARPLRLYVATKKWLIKNQFWQRGSKLVLVSQPQQKLKYLQEAVKLNLFVTFIDDLSYNHENGTIRYYDDIIHLLKQMNVTYLDNHWIQSINHAAAGSDRTI
jgi:hypothetical protein